MDWEIVIGLEIHAQLATRSKIFSGAATAYGAAPKSQACLVDLGYADVLPVLNADVVEDMRRWGYNMEPEQAKPGETVELTLYWEANQKPGGDYTVFTHLREPSGELHGQNDSQPQAGMYPTYLWDKGERVEDRYELVIAEDAIAGEYEIALGMYTLATLERLSIRDQEGSLAPDRQLLIPGPEVLR